jgi:hypothetical protein
MHSLLENKNIPVGSKPTKKLKIPTEKNVKSIFLTVNRHKNTIA